MAEAVKDVTTTEEVVADLVAEEALVVLEVKEAEAEKEKAQEVLDQEVEEIEVRHLDVKADLEAKEVHQLQEENQVLLKEKKELQDVLKEVLKDLLAVHLMKQKLKGLERVKLNKKSNYKFQIQ
jgi:hypothetical protein